ncbi:SpoIIE family protein phosphatase [Streptomyces sp. NPDC127190]|uniref:SpoIIE family protein phosphatase n=1 Tax=unclassified Streptomyces TaxID=2593676 RepID=UPI00362E7C85
MVKAMVDPRSRLILCSSAGHPPPVLVHPDAGCELLDRATDPPLGARNQHVPRPQADVSYALGDTPDALGHCATLAPEALADAVLARLGLAGARGDVALVDIRL